MILNLLRGSQHDEKNIILYISIFNNPKKYSSLTRKKFLGYELGDKFSFHHDAVAYFQYVSNTVNHISLV